MLAQNDRLDGHALDSPGEPAADGERPASATGATSSRLRVVAQSPGECSGSELAQSLEPMLLAVVRMTGASAAVVRGIGADGAIGTPVAAVGRPVSRRAPWCAVCDEDLGPDSDCVARHVLGVADEVVASAVTQVCHHVATIPLEHRDRPVGTLGLFFASPCRIAPEITPVLEAVGALLGVTLENGRLAAENLRMSLVSERQMMANEVHDSLAQALTYMRMRMSLLADAIRERDELRAFKYWSDVDDSLTHAHRRLRELITCFRSRMDPQGLVHALSETAAGFFDRTGVDLVFRNDVPDFCLPAEREVEVFHIVQEALANACRHAQARRVELSLDRGEAGSGYEITIVDDGVGLASGADGDADDAGHYGLSIMRERARRLGGSLALESAAGRGTRVRLSIPAAATASGKGT